MGRDPGDDDFRSSTSGICSSKSGSSPMRETSVLIWDLQVWWGEGRTFMTSVVEGEDAMK